MTELTPIAFVLEGCKKIPNCPLREFVGHLQDQITLEGAEEIANGLGLKTVYKSPANRNYPYPAISAQCTSGELKTNGFCGQVVVSLRGTPEKLR